MGEEQPGYASYLLRLWKVDAHGRQVWLASLESTRTGQRESFAGLEALVQFLQDRFGKSFDYREPNTSSAQREF